MTDRLHGFTVAIRQNVRAWPYTVAMLALTLAVLGLFPPLASTAYRAFVEPIAMPASERVIGVLGLPRRLVPDLNGHAAFESVSLLRSGILSADDPGAAPVRVTAVTSGFFGVVGGLPALGRPFLPADDLGASGSVAVVSYRFWRDHLDRVAVSRLGISRFGGVPFQVIGVMPDGFDFPAGTSAWVAGPNGDSTVGLAPRGFDGADVSYPSVIARLAPGHDRGVAEDAASALLASAQASSTARRSHIVIVGLEDYLTRGTQTGLKMFLMVAAALMAVSIAGVIGFQVVDCTARLDELKLSVALGASTWQAAVPWLRRDAVLLLVAGVGAAPLGAALSPVIAAIAPPELPGLRSSQPNGLWTFVAWSAWTCGALASRWIVVRLFGRYLTLRQSALPASRAVARWSSAAVGVEIAGAAALLICGALLVGRLWQMVHIAEGFSLPALAAEVFVRDGDVEGAASAVRKRLLEVASPGSVTYSTYLPLLGRGRLSQPVEAIVDGNRGISMAAPVTGVADDYFERLEVDLIMGSSFSETAQEAPVVVNALAAAALFPRQAAIGQLVRINGHPRLRRIIGIVPALRMRSLLEPASPEIFVPLGSHAANTLAILVVGPTTLTPETLRRTLSGDDQVLTAATLRTGRELRSLSYRLLTYLAALVAGAAILATIIAVASVCGVAAIGAHVKQRDVAIRIALGAGPLRSRLPLLRALQWPLGLGSAVGVTAGGLSATGMSRLDLGIAAPSIGLVLSTAVVMVAVGNAVALATAWKRGVHAASVALRLS